MPEAMDLRMHYLILFKSAATGSADIIPAQRVIGRIMLEWVLFRKYLSNEDRIETLAAGAGVLREDFASFLWACTGERFLTIRRRLRLEEAKSMLVDGSGKSFAQIAYEIGFQDKSDFRKAFKDETGFSPRAWRESGGRKIRCRIRELRDRGRNHCPAPRTSV